MVREIGRQQRNEAEAERDGDGGEHGERILFLHKSVGKCINRQSEELVIISAMRNFYSRKKEAVYC